MRLVHIHGVIPAGEPRPLHRLPASQIRFAVGHCDRNVHDLELCECPRYLVKLLLLLEAAACSAQEGPGRGQS